MFGKSEDRDDYQFIERPVGGMARDLPDRFFIDYHEHRRGQLIYAYAGSSGVRPAFTNSTMWARNSAGYGVRCLPISTPPSKG